MTSTGSKTKRAAGVGDTSKKTLGLVTMALLTTTAVASIRGLPAMAHYGLGSVFLYVVPAIVFLVPTALVPAELGSGWKGGVFGWVRAAYGDQIGFFAIWQQWVQNVVWFPVQLAFFATALAYVFEPSLSSNGFYVAAIILVVYWASTLIASRGVNAFAAVGSKGMLVGTIIPALALVTLAIIYLATGGKSNIVGASADWIPAWGGLPSIVLIVSNFLAYAGMEMNAVHVTDMQHPDRNYPRSILLACVLILLVFIPTTLAIAVAVPSADLNLTQGVLQAFNALFVQVHLPWGTGIMALLIVIGILASVVTWIPGPSRGLLMVAQLGYLPPRLQKTNKNDMQMGILTVQGVLVSVLTILFAIIPSVSAAFWMLSAMSIQFYLLMYIIMFMSGMRLRKIAPEVHRGFKTPAMTFIASLGIAASAAALLMGFVKPSGFGISQTAYALVLLIGVVVLGGAPFLIHHIRQPSWNPKPASASDLAATS